MAGTAAPIGVTHCSCGNKLNHKLNGVLQAKCTACYDFKRAVLDRGVASVLAANRATPKPLSDEAKILIKQIDDLLMDGYGWAEETLSGIRETILKTGHATDRQQQAVQNIEEGRRESPYGRS